MSVRAWIFRTWEKEDTNARLMKLSKNTVVLCTFFKIYINISISVSISINIYYILAVSLESPRNKSQSLVVIAIPSVKFAVFSLKAFVEMDKSVSGGRK